MELDDFGPSRFGVRGCAKDAAQAPQMSSGTLSTMDLLGYAWGPDHRMDKRHETSASTLWGPPDAVVMTQGETTAARNIVIVVDDDPGMLTGIRRLLRAHGFEVRVFTAAEDCLTGSDSSEAICIVLDINLKGQSGIDFCVQLRRDGINHPVIFITGIDSEIVHEAAVAAGCVAYLAKPFQAELLIGAIESAFTQGSAAMRTPRERA